MHGGFDELMCTEVNASWDMNSSFTKRIAVVKVFAILEGHFTIPDTSDEFTREIGFGSDFVNFTDFSLNEVKSGLFLIVIRFERSIFFDASEAI